METDLCVSTGDFKYKYKLKKGISINNKGGIKILKDLDYPQEIINCSF
jgi:hypothetical protein